MASLAFPKRQVRQLDRQHGQRGCITQNEWGRRLGWRDDIAKRLQHIAKRTVLVGGQAGRDERRGEGCCSQTV